MKPRLSFWQIWNMNFGYLGVQFGWGLQLANMSAIYSKLGADPDKIPILWLAGPVTGLLIQPLVGAFSDRTWTKLGRRKPYFLFGSLFASVALVLMPLSPYLWCAALLLWVLDASTNISQEPFRAFVADKLNKDQHTIGYIMLSFFVGVGHCVSAAMPMFMRKLGVEGVASNGIPLTVMYSFRLGALMFLLCILWTVITAKEYPPSEEQMKVIEEGRKSGLMGVVREVFGEIPAAIKEMPETMKQVGLVHMFTFLGLFCMWLFFGLTTAYHIFGATSPDSKLFNEGIEWGGWCFSIYSFVCAIVAFALPRIARVTSRKIVHAISLVLGGLSLLSIYLIHDPQTLQLTMVGIGITWASTLSMPYAILAASIPPSRNGVYMGIFNMSIVIPEVFAALCFQPLIKHVFHNNPLYVVMMGGIFLLIAACLVVRVKDDVEFEPIPIKLK